MPSATLDITLPMPHPGQRKVRQQMRRFSYLAAGRRWRKTTLGMSLVVEDILAGKESLWTAPTFDQVRIAWRELKKAAGGVFRFQHTEMYAEFPATRGICKFRSLDDPDNARGHSVTGNVYMDEAAFVDEAAWYEVLRPMLMDSGGGARFFFTPKGRNWIWREWELAAERADSIAWQAPTLGAVVVDGRLMRQPHPLENPEIPFDELAQIYATTPERMFRQEVLAEFLENAGGVFQNVQGCVGGALEAAPTHRHLSYVMGVDLAKYNDYTVVCVIDPRTRQVVAFERFNLADWHVQKERILAIARHWNNAVTWLDTTGLGDPIYDDLAREQMRIHSYKFTQQTKRELIDNAVLLVEQQQVRYPASLTTLISELSSYEYERLPGGGLRMNAPSGMHDDCVIAFALSCWPLAHTSAGISADAIAALHTQYTDLNARKLLGRTF